VNPKLKTQMKDRVARVTNAVHKELYRRSGGRIGNRIGKLQHLLLTTTGRKSGQPRTTPLNYGTDGDRIILIASYGGDDRAPQWYQNLVANPEVSVQVGPETRRMRATTATPEEKARYWPVMTANYPGYDGYQRKTERDIPVVVLDPV
jgi:deazaflavin-dependent oxidoreductase (nitroreductase family)